jgi:hypothetical protein
VLGHGVDNRRQVRPRGWLVLWCCFLLACDRSIESANLSVMHCLKGLLTFFFHRIGPIIILALDYLQLYSCCTAVLYPPGRKEGKAQHTVRDYGPLRGGGLRASPPAPDMRGMAEGRARAGRGTVGRPCGGYFHDVGSWRRRMAEQAGGSTDGRRQGLRASGARGGRPLLAARGRSAGQSHAERAHDRSTRRAARRPQRCWAAQWRRGGYLDNTPSAKSHCQHSGAAEEECLRSVRKYVQP